jgi:type I restriction enzyme, S subunit
MSFLENGTDGKKGRHGSYDSHGSPSPDERKVAANHPGAAMRPAMSFLQNGTHAKKARHASHVSHDSPLPDEPECAANHPGTAGKNGWEVKKVSEIAMHSLGKMLDKAKNKGEFRPYLRNLNVRWFDFDLSDLSEMRFLPEEAQKHTVKKGDLVICEGGYPGRAAIWERDEPIYFQKALHRVRFHEPQHAKWCLYYLYAQDLEGRLKSHFNGAGIQHFTGETLARFEVPLPPLPEQRRIVGILDEAFEGIATAKANAEKNLQNARELFESHLQSVFTKRGDGWVETKLDDVCHKITDGTHFTPTYVKEGVPFLSVKNLTKGFIDFSNTRYISVQEHDLLTKRCKAVRDDILYTKVGTTGIAQVVDVDEEFSIFVSVALLKPKHNVVYNLYLEHFLNAPFAREQARNRTRGMANKNLVIADIKRIEVHYPKSLDEQRGIVTKLEELSAKTQRLESIYQQKLAALDELKKSLLHQAFTGQL